MLIFDLFETEKGWVLAGADEEFDKLNLSQIKNIIGTNIIIKSDYNCVTVKVLDINFSNSILDKKIYSF